MLRQDDPTSKERVQEHERYHGERTVDAIATWAGHFVKQVKKEVQPDHMHR